MTSYSVATDFKNNRFWWESITQSNFTLYLSNCRI
jgi:hypothetical protein